MAWIDRLIDYVPDAETVGLVAVLGGSVEMCCGTVLADVPLWIGGSVLWLAGWAGPKLSARKQERHRKRQLALEEAEEDAAFAATRAALQRDLEAQRHWRTMIACQERPPLERLH